MGTTDKMTQRRQNIGGNWGGRDLRRENDREALLTD
jgi:hypothetical protein